MRERIRKIRKNRGLNQRDFAKKIDVGQSTLAMFEAGDREVRDVYKNRICSEFGVNREWLDDGIGSMYANKIEKSRKAIHERIRFLRKNILHLSQDELSKKLNMSRGNLSNIEINRINVTERVLTDITDKYGVRKEWLLYGEGDVFESKNDSVVRNMVFDILKIYNNLDVETQKAIDRFVLKLKEDIKKEDG